MEEEIITQQVFEANKKTTAGYIRRNQDMRKKLLCIFLALNMIFSMLPIPAMAEEADAHLNSESVIIEAEPIDTSTEDPVDTTAAEPQTVTDAVYGSGMPEAAAPMMMLTAGDTTVSEQFTEITPGSTYYFDLSSEKDKIGEVNTSLPDTTLHYVPFTYAGTVYAYSLHSRSLDDNAAKTDSVTADGNTTDPEHEIGYKSNRSLFVSDYNISNISWLSLSFNDLIFGKAFNTNYKLRVLSAGSNSDSAGDHYRKPDANEWDQILAKSSGLIKNWSGIWSWGQDTMANDGYGRMTRGNTSTYGWKNETYYFSNGFRPALEVLDPDTLGSDGLKEVTLNLNGGSLNGSTDNIKIICAGDSFTAPNGEALTAPVGMAFDGWKDTDSDTIYAEGSAVPNTVDGLTAQWGDDFIKNIETGKTYGTLQGAVNEVQNGETLQLLKDVKEKGITINHPHSFTLDLNGRILSSGDNNTITHEGSGTLKITDNSDGSGKVTSANTFGAGTIYLKGGSLEVAGGTVENTGPYASCSAVYNEGSGSVTVSGGDMISINGSTIYNHGSGNVNISSGTVKRNSGLAIQIDSSSTGNVHISGGTVEGTVYNSGSGSVNISGGTVKQTGTDYAVCSWGNGKITISGTTKVSSANTFSSSGTIFLMDGTATDTVLENKGGTIENTAIGGNGIYNGGNGKIVISSGSPVIIKGDGMAMNRAPDLSEYANVAVTASMDYSGSPVVAYNADYIGDYKYLKFEPAVPLTGTAAISNTTPRIGDVLNGSLVDHNNTGSLTFVWKADGAEVGTGASYTVTKADLGKAITLEISSSVESGTITSAATWAVLKKAAPTAPDSPILVSKTRNSVTLRSNALYEFSKDGSSWQTSNVFNGLTARTAYTFYQRIAETDDTESSAASTGLSVTTDASGSGSGGGRSSNKSTSSGSSGSSANNISVITITPPAPDKPDAPTQGEIKVKSNADQNGNAVVNITGRYVTEAINKAMAAAQRNGNAQNGITLILNAVTDGKPVSNVTVNLPKAVQDIIIARRIANTIVVVDNPNIRICMDLPTVEAINRQANSDVNVTAARRNNSELTGNARRAIGSRPVFDLKVNYGSGSQVQSFGAGSVWVTIPYSLGENEKAENVKAVYIDGNGKVHWITDSVYDSTEKVLRFRTNHFSVYGVGYREELPAFTDIAVHWAKQDIEFIVSRGLFKGTSDTTFSPDMDMTRGMFITVLGRLAEVDVSSYKQSSFTDVKNDAYYMGYIEWADKNGIDNGSGNGRFAPDQPITREQIAVIMQNCANANRFTLPKLHAENTFADSEKISTYAKDAVKLTQMAGIFTGKDGNLFDPQGTATRAEISAVLRRFIELADSNDTK